MEIEGSSQRPDVTVVLPVRNGAAFLDQALSSLLNQTHQNFRLLICDNASTDGTGEICDRFASLDDRVRVIRHEAPITALANFRFGYSQVETPYFLWAAHDDLRTPDYIESLMDALHHDPDAGVAFGQLIEFSEHDEAFARPLTPYECTTKGMSYVGRLNSRYKSKCVEIYGLWRTEVLRGYQWFDIEIGPDLPLLTYAVIRSDILQIEGPVFCQYGPPIPKTHQSRALDNSFGRLRPFRLVRLSWLCALAAQKAAADSGRRRSSLIAFLILYLTIATLRFRTIVFEASPPPMQRTYQRFKRRFSEDQRKGIGPDNLLRS